jgi:hypothetical protein
VVAVGADADAQFDLEADAVLESDLGCGETVVVDGMDEVAELPADELFGGPADAGGGVRLALEQPPQALAQRSSQRSACVCPVATTASSGSRNISSPRPRAFSPPRAIASTSRATSCNRRRPMAASSACSGTALRSATISATDQSFVSARAAFCAASS